MQSSVQEKLWELSDKEYAVFQAKLAPTINPETVMGVRVPKLREFAKTFKNNDQCGSFLAELPHDYYDENMLHSILLAEWKSYDECVDLVEKFLPYVDNWAVCDTLRPKVFKKHKEELLPLVKKWISSKETYTCRFGIDMLMTYYLDEDFKPEYLELPTAIVSDEYYVNMMIAWYFATALAKQWDAAVVFIEEKRLTDWTHNKAIQKAKESFRITPNQKEYLNSLKVK